MTLLLTNSFCLKLALLYLKLVINRNDCEWFLLLFCCQIKYLHQLKIIIIIIIIIIIVII